ncbi:MAG: B12-binding domain-containing radical SAM protein [Chitinophagales bacterium]|nr:B12-binding domain-containing radical SAM protein [Chitinophagales bacterium]
MKVLLTHGYFLHEDPKEQQIMKPYVPLGILYISAYLERNNIDNEVFDSTFSSFDTLKTYIATHQPTYIAMYVNLMTKLNVLKIISFVKNHPQLKDTPLILGGPEVKNHAQNFLNHGADYLVIGEGEESCYELIKALERGEKEKLMWVNGLCFKDTYGNAHFTTPREKIKNIDDLPFPNRKKVDLTKYLSAWKERHGKNAISVSTMRGCPYTCKWCSRAVYGLSYRRRSAESVVAELTSIKNTYNPDTVWFVDDVFTVSHKWLQEFRDEIKKKNVQLDYECITRADRLTEEVFQLLKESGCFRVWIGAESGSQKIIDAMNRRVDVNKVREMIQLAKKYGIEAGTFIMLGYPGETEADIEETIHHLKTSNPDHFTITIAYPIKGTELYQEVESDFTTHLPWENSTDRDIDFKRTYSRKYYDYAVRRVVNEVFYYKSTLRHSLLHTQTMKLKLKSVAAKSAMWFYRTVHS